MVTSNQMRLTMVEQHDIYSNIRLWMFSFYETTYTECVRIKQLISDKEI